MASFDQGYPQVGRPWDVRGLRAPRVSNDPFTSAYREYLDTLPNGGWAPYGMVASNDGASQFPLAGPQLAPGTMDYPTWMMDYATWMSLMKAMGNATPPNADATTPPNADATTPPNTAVAPTTPPNAGTAPLPQQPIAVSSPGSAAVPGQLMGYAYAGDIPSGWAVGPTTRGTGLRQGVNLTQVKW